VRQWRPIRETKPLIVIVGVIVVLAAVFGPGLWARWVMARHGDPRPDFPGTGGELARHLLDDGGLAEIRVESTGEGDHYSPDDKAVRLRPEHHDGTSLTAVAVARTRSATRFRTATATPRWRRGRSWSRRCARSSAPAPSSPWRARCWAR